VALWLSCLLSMPSRLRAISSFARRRISLMQCSDRLFQGFPGTRLGLLRFFKRFLVEEI
jgi:hypothetical protein